MTEFQDHYSEQISVLSSSTTPSRYIGAQMWREVLRDRLLGKLHSYDRTAAKWLAYLCALSALKYLRSIDVEINLDALSIGLLKLLETGVAPQEILHMAALMKSPFSDCRQCDAQSAMDAVESCALFLQSSSKSDLADCIDDACLAFEHVTKVGAFESWVFREALTAALRWRIESPAKAASLFSFQSLP